MKSEEINSANQEFLKEAGQIGEMGPATVELGRAVYDAIALFFKRTGGHEVEHQVLSNEVAMLLAPFAMSETLATARRENKDLDKIPGLLGYTKWITLKGLKHVLGIAGQVSRETSSVKESTDRLDPALERLLQTLNIERMTKQ